jgi:NAD(P)H-quinone oxidoreductase subunit 4
MLSTLILLPLIGAALIGFYPFGITAKLTRIIAFVFSIIIFLWSTFLATQFNPGEIGQQFAESLA